MPEFYHRSRYLPLFTTGLLSLLMAASGCSSSSSGGGATAFEPRYAYLLNEEDPSVAWYRMDPETDTPRFAGYLYLGEHDAEAVEDMVITPDGRFIYVSDSTGSQVHILEADPATGSLTHNGVEDFGDVTTEPGAMAMSPQGDAIYIAREQASPGDNVRAFAIDETDGSLSLGTTPDPAILDDLPDELAISPEGDRLFGTSRDNNRVKVFAVDGTSTVQRLADHTETLPAGAVPQNLAVGPEAQHLYVVSAGGADEHFRAYAIGDDGALELLDETGAQGQQQVSVTPDNRAIITVGAGNTNANVYALDTDNGDLEYVQQIGAPPGGTSLNNIVAVSPDPTGQHLMAITSGMTAGNTVYTAALEDVEPEDYLFDFGSLSREAPARIVWATGNPVAVTSAHMYVGDANDDSSTIERFIIGNNGGLSAPISDEQGSDGIAGLTLMPNRDVMLSLHRQGVGAIYAWQLDPLEGTITSGNVDTGDLDPPVEVVADPQERFAYVVEEAETSAVSGRLRVYEYFPQSGQVNFSGGTSTTATPVAMAMDPAGRWLYIGRDDHDIEQWEIGPDGSRSSETLVTGNNNIRDMQVSPSGKSLLVTESQRIRLYTINPDNGSLTEADTASSGEIAESMLAVHPDGEHVYTAASAGSEMRLAVFTLDEIDGDLTHEDFMAYDGLAGSGNGSLTVRPEGDMLYATVEMRDEVRAIPLGEDRAALPGPGEISNYATVDNARQLIIRSVIE